jgi:transposase
MDEQGKPLGQLRAVNDPDGLKKLLDWSKGFADRKWAIEGANNPFCRPLVNKLQNQGETLWHIHPSLTSQYRSKGGRKKNDAVDAENAAKVLLANPELKPYKPHPRQIELQQLYRTRARLVEERKANAMALKELQKTQQGVHPSTQTLLEALQQVIQALKKAITSLEKQLLKLVREIKPSLLDLDGVGPIVAACILAEVGDISRFPSAHHLASYCGVSPIERGSGKVSRNCVNTGGNRRLNHALHLAVLTRMRLDLQDSKAFIEKKTQQGKTKREAIRALKTYLAREIFHHLVRS